jgi:hypothetical protein
LNSKKQRRDVGKTGVFPCRDGNFSLILNPGKIYIRRFAKKRMERSIKMPKKLIQEINRVALESGFRTNSEFVEEAVRQKMLELKKAKFFEITNRVSRGLKKSGTSFEKILGER